MVKVYPEKHLNITRQNLEKILVEYGITSFEFESFNKGIANTSVKIITSEKIYVLRIYRQERRIDAEIELEIKFQDFLRENNLPIPVIYKNNDDQELTRINVEGKTWQVLLIEFKEGQHEKDYPDDLLKRLSRTQAKMHLLGIVFAKEVKEHPKVITNLKGYSINELPNLDIDIQEFLRKGEKLDIEFDPKLPSGYNHLDLDFEGNILIKDNLISAILDFDDLSYCTSVICLGYTLWHILFTTNSWDKVYSYLDEYQKIRPLTKGEIKSLPEIIYFRNFMLGEIFLTLWKDYASLEQTLKLEKLISGFNYISSYKNQ